jgi:hypothetical protein
MIRKWVYSWRLKRMDDVSPALRLVASAAIPRSSRRVRKAILSAIRNTREELSDPASVKDAKEAVDRVATEAELRATETRQRLDSHVRAGRGMMPRGQMANAARRGSNRALAKWSSDQGSARRLVEILNGYLQSIGRPGI